MIFAPAAACNHMQGRPPASVLRPLSSDLLRRIVAAHNAFNIGFGNRWDRLLHAWRSSVPKSAETFDVAVTQAMKNANNGEIARSPKQDPKK